MSQVNVEFDMVDLQRVVDRFGKRWKNLPMEVVGQILLNVADDIFQTQGASSSEGAWEPLKDTTLARNPRRIGGMLLQATGAMANLQIISVDEHSVEIGSPAEYASFHIEGTRNMDRRDFFAFNFDEVLAGIEDVLLQELV